MNLAKDPQGVGPLSTLRREAQLLLCCARTTLDDTAHGRAVQLLQQNINWDYFVQLVVRHRVVPLVTRSLGDAQLGAVPPAVRADLTQQSAHIAWRNLFLTGKLVELLGTLGAHGVRALSYKGPAIAAFAYGSINLRQFWDLDVLVNPPDYHRARDVLLSRGDYELRENYGWECLLVNPTGTVSVDLHRYLAPDVLPGALWFDRLWNRSQRLALAGGLQTLSPEDILVMLTIQLRKDAWETKELRLSKICDIAELLRSHPTLDWDAIYAAARRLGCRRALSLALTVAQELLAAPVSAAIAERVDSTETGRLIGYVCHRLFSDDLATASLPMSYEDFHFRVRERWRDRLYSWYSRPRVRRVVRHFRPSAKDHAMIALPVRLRFLYYLVRPIRVGRDYARAWFKGQ